MTKLGEMLREEGARKEKIANVKALLDVLDDETIARKLRIDIEKVKELREVENLDMEMQNIEEIKNQYKGYYVYIDNCKIGEYGSVEAGRVVFHEKDKELFYNKVRETRSATTTYILPLVEQENCLNIPFIKA